MAIFLAFKEVIRNKGRFFLFSLVIALITSLVLFVAALAEGLAQANREYLSKLDADLLVFQENSKFSTFNSRLSRSLLNDVRRIPGIQAAGPIGFSNATIEFFDGRAGVDVSLIGVEANQPGSVGVISGSPFASNRANEAIIDINIAERGALNLGDTIQIKTIQGAEEEFYSVRVIGITDSRENQYAPALFLPYQTWERIRPKATLGEGSSDSISNIFALKLQNPTQAEALATQIPALVSGVEVTDIRTAYEALPGYSAQQSTLQTQQAFVLLIGILVIGGFFQIQMLQKVPQIGVLKAIGVDNRTVASAVVAQIILITTFGVLLGGLATLGLAAGIPGNVPVEFAGSTVALAILALLAIGPIGGLVSVRLAVRVEPLIALGLSQ